MEFENGILKFKTREILLPDEIMAKARAYYGEMDLVEDGEEIVYTGDVKKKVRLFAIIPISMNANVKLDAETGDLLSLEQPWWAAFTVQ